MHQTIQQIQLYPKFCFKVVLIDFNFVTKYIWRPKQVRWQPIDMYSWMHVMTQLTLPTFIKQKSKVKKKKPDVDAELQKFLNDLHFV